MGENWVGNRFFAISSDWEEGRVPLHGEEPAISAAAASLHGEEGLSLHGVERAAGDLEIFFKKKNK